MVDELGVEQDFALLYLIDVDSKRYGIFGPADSLEGGDEDEDAENPAEVDPAADEDDEDILVLRAVQRDGEQDFEVIEDEAEFNRVLSRLDQMVALEGPFGSGTHNN
jgi:hypothetical protein